MRRLLLPQLMLLVALAAAGCDYSIIEEAPSPVAPGGSASVAITVRPADTTVQPGRTIQLRATVTGSTNTAVTWTKVSGPGRIYPDGLFVAPADSTGMATIRVRAAADTTKSATATVRIVADSSTGGNEDKVLVSVSPSAATIATGGSQLFSATVTGTPNTGVNWSIVGGGPGTIGATGLYTAPLSISGASMIVTIQATALADAAAIGRATVTVVTPTDPNRICFDREILPIFVSNCAMSGCHDPATREEGYDFTKASGVRRGVVPGDSHESEIFEKITENDPDKLDERMPPPPRSPLTPSQIDLIRRWIEAGADTTTCPPETGGCDTTNVTWTSTVRPIIETNCLGCHNGGTDFNRNVDLATHAGAQRVALSGQLYGALSHAPGFAPMPQGTAPLDSCTIEKIKAWITAGAPAN